MEIEKSKVLIKFLLNFRQSGNVLFFLNVRRLRGYTATTSNFGRRFAKLFLELTDIVRLKLQNHSMNIPRRSDVFIAFRNVFRVNFTNILVFDL